ncbi:hypothetical protein HHK36_030314 [Tetracentron sinense]|uniref:Uncharacterized protein n=1 Tax=Tetracentron sinense TaxID=13715 RepID=A0A834Y714_TETSI|nr:hypothetical protein HHK36_030314 [Tetracentron sinense]
MPSEPRTQAGYPGSKRWVPPECDWIKMTALTSQLAAEQILKEMGSGSSKDASASSSVVQRARSKGTRVFQSSCLCRPSRSYDSDNDDQVSNCRSKENDGLSNETCRDQIGTESDQVKCECGRRVKVPQPSEVPSISSDVELDEWGQSSVTDTVSRAGSSSDRVSSTRSLNPSSHFRSHFSFIPGNISFRLSRAASLGSSGDDAIFSRSPRISNTEEEFHLHTGSTSNSVNRNENRQGSDLLPSCSIDGSPAPQYEGTSSGALEHPASGPLVHLHHDEIVSTQDLSRFNQGTGSGVNGHSPRNFADMESFETRRSNRRIGAREPVERSVRFSRTLSVGRLRDRVLRRSSFSDVMFGHLEQNRSVRDASRGSGRRAWGGGNAETTSSRYPPSSMPSSMYSRQDYEVETSPSREARYHSLMEHRADFLERRRRIRSQVCKLYVLTLIVTTIFQQHGLAGTCSGHAGCVRALQRLGSRFENLSGHERSCILSGQHRTGHCTCRTSFQAANPDDDTSARASISRIVMLAEALFEVLDEIHQQSVVLSSQPSMSSIGSVPAPKEVVESMPVEICTKSGRANQNEEAAQ